MPEKDSEAQKKIDEAIKLLRDNDYLIIKFTDAMQKDADKCEESGGSKECLGCSCNVCVIQC